jgi:MFS transporter, SHS family, sialic acid transporter
MHTPGPVPPTQTGDNPPKTWWFSGAERGQWLALAAALLGWAFDGFEMGVFPLVARPALIDILNLSADDKRSRDESLSAAERKDSREKVDELVRQWNGALSAVFLIGAALGGLLFGWIGDRLGRVRAMMLSVLTYAVLTGACGLVREAWLLVMLRFLAALGMGGEWSLGVALVMETWGAHARPVLAGLIGAAANLGFALVAVLGLVLEPTGYWRWILAACTFPALLTFLLRMFVPESKQWEHAAASGPRAQMTDIFVPGLRRNSLLGAGLGAVALLATWGGVQLIPLWVGSKSGPAAKAQLVSALGATAGAFLGAVVGHRFRRRVGYAGLCVLALVTCEFFFVGLADAGAPALPFDGWLFLSTAALVGATSAAFYGWLPLYLPELFPTRVRATGQGFCYNFGRILSAIGVLLTTFIFSLQGNFAQTSAIVCLVYVVGIGLAWFIPETRGQPLPE